RRGDIWLKFHAIEALGEIGDRAALPAILPLYNETSLRKPVLEAIGKIGDVGTVPFLLKIIAEEDKLNLTALRALVRIAEARRTRWRRSFCAFSMPFTAQRPFPASFRSSITTIR